MSAVRRVRVHAPAKVNLWLDVLARRDDGYHELDTGLLALELGDVLELRELPAGAARVVLDGPFASPDVPTGERNLALRALHACRAALGVEAGFELRLTKNVPSRAGLGGGSSDAAAAVLACECLHGVSLGPGRARELLAGLGSDCVFFHEAASTGFGRATGRGERVLALDAPALDWTLVVLVPDVGAGTGEVYSALTGPLSESSAATTVCDSLLRGDESDARGALTNRLEPAALSAVEGLAPWRGALDDAGAAHFRLSGSGSSFFGLFRSGEAAASCLSTLAETLRTRGLSPRALWSTRPARRGVSVVSSPGPG